MVIVPLNCALTVEKTRMESPAEIRTRLDELDHKKNCMLDVKSAGRAITRTISRERVPRMVSFDGSAVAMYAPSGLGSECADAIKQTQIS